MEQQIIDQLEKLNLPFIKNSLSEEVRYSLSLGLMSIVGFFLAYYFDFKLSACLFFISFTLIVFNSRLTILSNDRQCVINENVLVHSKPAEENTYSKIVSIFRWVVFGSFILSGLTFFIH